MRSDNDPRRFAWGRYVQPSEPGSDESSSMLFNSSEFLVFFVAFYALYLGSARSLRAQNSVLLVASYLFYGYWDWRFLGLIAVSTVADYVYALLLDRRQDRAAGVPHSYYYGSRWRRAILCLSLITNLGILGFFKYFDFFVGSCATMLEAIGLPLEPRLLHVVLPVGISFYTFQTLSYTIDVYRGTLRANRSLLQFGVFVAFFPQLVAGPILRASQFLPQVARARRIRRAEFYEGGYLVLWGLFKKMVIADNLARVVAVAYDPGAEVGAGTVVIGTYAFAFQIYCDFSGYCDIARGCAKFLGFDLPLNFNLPYFARNPSDFWRRWHISLSQWLRDYLYIPLGGNKKGSRRTCINLLLTMLLGGLWHGAAWTFVLWGALHGCVLVAYRVLEPTWQRVTCGWRAARWRSAVSMLVFFHVICLSWLVFRAESIHHVGQLLAALVRPIPAGADLIVPLVVFGLPLLIVQVLQYYRDDLNVILRLPAVARGAIYATMFYGIVLVGVHADNPFIYFQF